MKAWLQPPRYKDNLGRCELLVWQDGRLQFELNGLGTSDNTRKMLEDCSTLEHSWSGAIYAFLHRNSFPAACELNTNPTPYTPVARFIIFNLLHRLTPCRKTAGRDFTIASSRRGDQRVRRLRPVHSTHRHEAWHRMLASGRPQHCELPAEGLHRHSS